MEIGPLQRIPLRDVWPHSPVYYLSSTSNITVRREPDNVQVPDPWWPLIITRLYSKCRLYAKQY